MAKTRASAKGKGSARRPARRSAPRKAATTLPVKTKVSKKEAKALIDLFQGNAVDVEPEYDPVDATLTMLRVSPTKAGTD